MRALRPTYPKRIRLSNGVIQWSCAFVDNDTLEPVPEVAPILGDNAGHALRKAWDFLERRYEEQFLNLLDLRKSSVTDRERLWTEGRCGQAYLRD